MRHLLELLNNRTKFLAKILKQFIICMKFILIPFAIVGILFFILLAANIYQKRKRGTCGCGDDELDKKIQELLRRQK